MTTTNPLPNDPTQAPERGAILGFLLIGLLCGLLVVALRSEGGAKDVAMGLYLMAWGGMFLAAFFFSHKTFFLRGLMWFCLKLSAPSTPKMALFYAAVTGVMGAASVMVGLGMF